MGFIFGGLGGMILGTIAGVIVGGGGAFLITNIVTSEDYGVIVTFHCAGLAIFGAIMGVIMIIKSLWGVGQP
ncbi:hypothetical protein HUU05_19135 [candidate division KSB1 bacterium]|nr:hypothetical protein [candidate division KSB1 bacterium]